MLQQGTAKLQDMKRKKNRIRGILKSRSLFIQFSNSSSPLEDQHHQDDKSYNKDKQLQNTPRRLVFEMLRHPLPEERLQTTGARDRATIRTRLSSIAEGTAIASAVRSSVAITGTLINSLPALGTNSHSLRPRLLTAFAHRLSNNLPLNFLLLDDVDMAHDIHSLKFRDGPDPFTDDFNLLQLLDGLEDSLLPVFVLRLRAGLALSANDLAGVDNGCKMDSLGPLDSWGNLAHWWLHWLDHLNRSWNRDRNRSRSRNNLLDDSGESRRGRLYVLVLNLRI